MRRIPKDLSCVARTRMTSARNLSKLTLDQASEKLGYSGRSALWKVETGYRNVSPTIDLLIRCSKLYGVSMDYLLGLSIHPEGDPKTIQLKATLRQVDSFLQNHSKKIASQLIKFSTEQAPVNLLYSQQQDICIKLIDAFNLFKSKNDFDELPAGNKLNICMNNLEKKNQEIQRELSVTNDHDGYFTMVDDLINEQEKQRDFDS